MAEASPLTLADLQKACSPGGGSALLIETELAPAGGQGAVVAPARVLDRDEAVYAFERRATPESGEPHWVTVIDSIQSQSNRDEDAVVSARRDGTGALSDALNRVPTVQIEYDGECWSDLQVPHRVFDGHFRSGTIDGRPATEDPRYRALRDTSPLNARPLLEAAPGTLLWGGWDSTRKKNQARFQRCLSGEIIGVLTDQGESVTPEVPRKAAGRVDPIAASVKPSEKDVATIVAGQRSEISDKLANKITSEAKAKGEKGSSMSTLGLGNIAPSLNGLAGVSCSSITRRRILSFAALRQLRFGSGLDADVACRVLLAAYGLLAMTLSDQELFLRANCELVEAGEPKGKLDLRFGRSQEISPLDPQSALSLFDEALAEAERVADLHWDGQVLLVQGNPIILGAAEADDQVGED